MDLDQLQRLVDQHAAALQLYASQWTDAPEDSMQEALLRLIRQSPPPDDPAAWLFRVVKNVSISQSRQESRRRRRETSVAEQTPQWFTPKAGAIVDAQEAAAALRALDDEQREVIIARIWGGLTYEQIALALETSPATAYRRYTEGLTQLRERLSTTCSKNRISPTS